jgi:hypothetical protein
MYICLYTCICIDIMHALYVNLNDLVEAIVTTLGGASSLEPTASSLEPGAGSLAPSVPVCEEEADVLSEVRDVHLSEQVESHLSPRCGRPACYPKGYVDVGSGGIKFTESVHGCGTPFFLQLTFESLAKIEDVRRTTDGQYLEFKVGSVFYMFDFGDALNFQSATRFVTDTAVRAISARRPVVVWNHRVFMKLMSPCGNGSRVRQFSVPLGLGKVFCDARGYV